jgi:dipeptidyl aminopeptidase/acylaminoacyl peptidase
MQDFRPDDLYLHVHVSDVHCVPGLDRAAAAVKGVDRENDQYTSRIWSFPLSGGEPRQLTHGPGLENSPRWSPDGDRLAFISSRTGAPQIFLLDDHGGESRQLTQFEMGVTQLGWASDGKSILATAALPVDPDLRGRRGKSVAQRSDSAAEVCWRLPYKADGVGYRLGREIHLFSIDVIKGDARQLTDGAFDVESFAASPNGKHIAYSRTREGRYAHCTDLWVCDADGSRHRRLTHELATVMQPVWSPDGSSIAFGGAVEEGDGQTSLWLLDFASGDLTALGPVGLEVADTQNMFWSRDGKRLILARAFRGRHEAVSLEVPAGELTTLVSGKRQFGAFACNSEHLLYAVDAPDHAIELFACRMDGTAERPLSRLNPWWRDRTPIEVEEREFKVPDGRGGTEVIHGWLLYARDAKSKGPMPLLDDAHGGPASYALLDYETNVYWQALCSRGWAILLLNAVGSSSFGREFCERLSGHWGEYDLPQHLAAIEQLRGEGICDERVAIAGKSYGGHFTSWAIGHTETYRAAVVMAPVGNIETHYGTSDGGYYADPLYVDAAPRFDRQRARELSPLQYVERAVTPTLFMQGKDDERCPKCQSEELFVSLYRAGNTPAELVLYPGEDHHFLGAGKPSNRADAARRITEWLTRHVGLALPAGKRHDEQARSEEFDRVSS